MSHNVDKFVMDAFHSTSADLSVIEAACDLLMEMKKESKYMYMYWKTFSAIISICIQVIWFKKLIQLLEFIFLLI